MKSFFGGSRGAIFSKKAPLVKKELTNLNLYTIIVA